jgi:hypothetical protein
MRGILRLFSSASQLNRARCARRPALIAPLCRSTLCAVQIINRANLSFEAQAELECELPEFGTLQQFVGWGSRQQPPVFLLETVALDEYTHEVIAGWRNGLFLAFAAT